MTKGADSLMPPDVRSRADALILAGAVTVLIAGPSCVPTRKPWWLQAVVADGSATYWTGLGADRGWWCTCEEPGCAHVAAVRLVSGQDGPARPGESG